jgi:hypothetical protein
MLAYGIDIEHIVRIMSLFASWSDIHEETHVYTFTVCSSTLYVSFYVLNAYCNILLILCNLHMQFSIKQKHNSAFFKDEKINMSNTCVKKYSHNKIKKKKGEREREREICKRL